MGKKVRFIVAFNCSANVALLQPVVSCSKEQSVKGQTYFPDMQDFRNCVTFGN